MNAHCKKMVSDRSGPPEKSSRASRLWFRGAIHPARGMLLAIFVLGPTVLGYTQEYTLTTPAGPGWGPGAVDSPVAVARLNSPLGVVADAAGNKYVADTYNNTVRKITPAGLDLDGNPRIAGGTVDIGTYEFQSPQLLISYAWLQQYGLPTDGSADDTDTDGDGLNNWQEWRAGTNPTNAFSTLRLFSPTFATPGVIVNWQSVSGRNYFLERGTDLSAQPPFHPLATDIIGQPGTTTFTDTMAVGAGPFFYRLGVQG